MPEDGAGVARVDDPVVVPRPVMNKASDSRSI